MVTPWQVWIEQDDLARLQDWLDKGGNIEDRLPSSNNTPLSYAANLGRQQMVEVLLERGAKTDSSAAFLGAVIGGHGNVARLLLAGADAQELREAYGLLISHMDDEELESLVKERLTKLRRLQGKKNSKRPAPPPKVAKKARAGPAKPDQQGAEAQGWLEENRHGLLRCSRFTSTTAALRFVKKLYALGARRVLVDRDYYTEGRPQRFALWVLLPKDAGLREQLVTLCDKEMYGFPMPVPSGRNPLYLCWDWD